MAERNFKDVIEDICRKDPRYAPEAYGFVCDALHFTTKLLGKPAEGPERHVSGAELLEGIRTFALQEFGPMTITVLKSWGVTHSSNFGDIVFNMVESKIFGRTATDKREDFQSSYDFEDAFARPFLPAAKQ